MAMSERADSFIGVNQCGCVTAWMDRRSATRADVRDFYRSMADTERSVQLANLDEVREKLKAVCPHD